MRAGVLTYQAVIESPFSLPWLISLGLLAKCVVQLPWLNFLLEFSPVALVNHCIPAGRHESRLMNSSLQILGYRQRKLEKCYWDIVLHRYIHFVSKIHPLFTFFNPKRRLFWRYNNGDAGFGDLTVTLWKQDWFASTTDYGDFSSISN